jgi:hypothetical protein
MALIDSKIANLKNGRKILIRCAQEGDASALLEAFKLSFLDGAGMILTLEEYTLTEDEVKTWIKAHIEGPKDFCCWRTRME